MALSREEVYRRILALPDDQQESAAQAALELYGPRPQVPGQPKPIPHDAFQKFVEEHNPKLLRYEHIPRLVSVGQRMLEGVLKRVLVCMPPQYFKTEVFGRLLPACYLRYRRRRAAIISYGADLAWNTSEEARDYFTGDGGKLRKDTSAKRLWKADTGATLWATGTGGPMLGFGYDLGIVDDPTDPEKAHSPVFQRKFREWWTGKFLSRMGPACTIGLVMQRLGIEDPVDFLLRREVGEVPGDPMPRPEHWHVVICDELKSDEPLGRWDGPRGLPPTCTVEPDPRATGEALAPSYRPKDEVDSIHLKSATYVTSAQRQQRPSKPQGDFWKVEWFNTYDVLPDDAYNGGYDWDLAYTEEERNSACAYIQSFRGRPVVPKDPTSFPIYIEDVDWDWVEFPELVYWMGGPFHVSPHVPIRGPHSIEEKASGKSAAQALRKANIVAKEVLFKGDKFTRSIAVQPVVSTGRVWVKRTILERLLNSERQGLLRVTAEGLVNSIGDLDVNDAFTQAIMRHTGSGRVPGVVIPGSGSPKPGTVVTSPGRPRV